MEPLAKWCPSKTVLRYKDLKEISCNFRHWYFSIGRLFISQDSMNYYRNFQDEIVELSSNQYENGIVSDHQRELIRKLSSELRYARTKDIAARSKPMAPSDENVTLKSNSDSAVALISAVRLSQGINCASKYC
jgi:hypothetical protein